MNNSNVAVKLHEYLEVKAQATVTHSLKRTFDISVLAFVNK